MLKKSLTLGIIGLSALIALSSCASHTHTEDCDWDRDTKEHWHLNEKGEKAYAAAHEIKDDGVCSVCGSELLLFDDSSAIFNYDKYGNLVRITNYYADGSVENDSSHVFTYDGDGNIITDHAYENGVLTGYSEYKITEDGENVLAKYSYYYQDGSYVDNECDEFGNTTAILFYNENKALIHESYCEYTLGSGGEYYASKQTDISEDGTKIVCEYNEFYDVIATVERDADGNVTLDETYEYTYDSEGRTIFKKTFRGGAIFEEIEYQVRIEDDGWSTFPKSTTEYFEGGKTVCVYDEEGDLESTLTYDANGNVIE